MKIAFWLWMGSILAIMLWGVAVLTSLGVAAHSWYDPACCSEKDCRPVDDEVVIDDDGSPHLEVKGHGYISKSDPRVRTSKDGQAHICEAPKYEGGVKLLCIYRKPRSF
jgi:hypothetical protein